MSLKGKGRSEFVASRSTPRLQLRVPIRFTDRRAMSIKSAVNGDLPAFVKSSSFNSPTKP